MLKPFKTGKKQQTTGPKQETNGGSAVGGYGVFDLSEDEGEEDEEGVDAATPKAIEQPQEKEGGKKDRSCSEAGDNTTESTTGDDGTAEVTSSGETGEEDSGMDDENKMTANEYITEARPEDGGNGILSR